MYNVSKIIKTIDYNKLNLKMITDSFLKLDNFERDETILKKIDQVTGILYLMNPLIFPDLIYYAKSINEREQLSFIEKKFMIIYIIKYFNLLDYDEILFIWQELI